MDFLGADTEALVDVAGRCRDAGERLVTMSVELDGIVEATEWTGPDADAFRAGGNVPAPISRCAGTM